VFFYLWALPAPGLGSSPGQIGVFSAISPVARGGGLAGTKTNGKNEHHHQQVGPPVGRVNDAGSVPTERPRLPHGPIPARNARSRRIEVTVDDAGCATRPLSPAPEMTVDGYETAVLPGPTTFICWAPGAGLFV